MKKNKKICVVGASDLVGSSIVRYALEKGYFVNGTLRDKSDITRRLVGTMVGITKPLSGLKRKKTPKTEILEGDLSL